MPHPDPPDYDPEVYVDVAPPPPTVTGAQPGVALRLQGTVEANRWVRSFGVFVRVGGIDYPAVVRGSARERPWTCEVRFYRTGATEVLVQTFGRALGGEDIDPTSLAGETFNIGVTLDSAVPELTIRAPTAGPVSVSENGELIPVQAVTSDQFGPRSVEWRYGGTSGPLARDALAPTVWNGQLRLEPLPLGDRVISVRCWDPGGNEHAEQVTISVTDGSPPNFTIVEPAPDQAFLAGPGGITVIVRGSAWDTQSGMAAGAVEWSLTGGDPFTAAATADQWATWRAEVPVQDIGTSTITLRFRDTAGRSRTTALPIRVVSSYRPGSLTERLSPRSYLEALLSFVREVVRGDGGSILSTGDLQNVLLQPFGRLSQPLSAIGALGDQSLAELRVPIEILRRHVESERRLLAARWSFDRDSVLPADAGFRDLSGNGHLARPTGGIVLEESPAGGQAIRFDGTTRWLQVDHAPELALGRDDGDFSVCLFLQPATGPTGTWRNFLHKGADNVAQRTFAMWLQPDLMRVHARISTQADTNEGLDSRAALTPGQWIHLAYVKRSGDLELYINGQLDNAVTLGGPVVANEGPLYIGKDPWHSGVDGAVDDLRLYALALSPATIAALAQTRSESPLEAARDAGERRYRETAYDTLLAELGTSYEELRLVRGAPTEERTALASRLGIRLTSASPDELEQLTLDGAALSEASLETLFGLLDTDLALDPLRQPPNPLVLQWRETAQELRWTEADASTPTSTSSSPVIVDPDVVGDADLVPASGGGPAAALLTARRQQLADAAASLRDARAGAPDASAAYAAMLAEGLPGADVDTIEADRAAGEDVTAALEAIHVTPEAFARIIRIGRLADAGPVTDAEWQDLEDILIQAGKGRSYLQWRAEESTIAISPRFFRAGGEPPVASRWRVGAEARSDWERLLRSRIDERSALRDAHAASVAAAEAVALPVLRDALVAALAGERAQGDAGDWLTERYQLDMRAGGVLRSTRIAQACETLQSLLFSVRSGRLPQGHPADDWTIPDETGFDAQWPWMSGQDAWRSAMMAFLFPENLLLPSLLPDTTGAFGALLGELRQRERLSPEEARGVASAFFARQQPVLLAGLPAPAAHWPFEDLSGSTVPDASGQGSAGTLIGANVTTGPVGSGLTFDGAGDHVTVAGSASLRAVENTFTLAFWAEPRSPQETDPEGAVGAPGMSGQKYALGPLQGQISWGDASHAGLGVSVGINGVSVYEHSAAYLPAVLVYEAPITGWTHVAVVYEDRRPRLYLDGVLVRRRDQQSPPAHVHACPEAIGGMGYGYFHGSLDDVRIYPAALSDAQIELLAFRLTDQRREDQFDRLRALSTRLLAPYRSAAPPPTFTPAAQPLMELFYFAPMAIALQLQAARAYLAALDWLQAVYAYTLPPARRLVSHVLGVERSGTADLTPNAGWTTRLNPHQVAAGRPNPYTRFTLAALARCCAEFGDQEFSLDGADAIARARGLYATAGELLEDPDLRPQVPADPAQVPFANPVLDELRGHVALQLAKLRQGRNIAGMPRPVEPPAATGADGRAETGADGGRLAARVRPPTPYRHRFLIERARTLAGAAQQVEVAYLDAMEKHDAAEYRRFDAAKALDLAGMTVGLQGLRVTEADRGVSVARRQVERAGVMADGYDRLLYQGLNRYERAMLDSYSQIRDLRTVIGGIDAAIGTAQGAMQAAGLSSVVESFGARVGIAASIGLAQTARAIASGYLNAAERQLQADTLLASHEHQRQEWYIARAVAYQDGSIAREQVFMAQDQALIARQEERVARRQEAQARATVEFLDRQFTNRELYTWMAGVLSGVYRYFLQQATATARLAQDQISFERQEPSGAFVQSDYWRAPEAAGGEGNGARERRGLTGSARLLQDITQLEQYALESDRRKLNLTQTFSLAQHAPLELELFRESGVLRFATPMQRFDADFPGDYQRLIRRVRMSLVALVPPGRGIRATLTASGLSRVVVRGDGFQEVVVRRQPERVGLTSPVSASGVFELDEQTEMLLPFESMGVDTTWELQLPRAANPFDFRSIADVLFTVEYRAFHDADYRRQVLERLAAAGPPRADRIFSLRRDFADEWYTLHNPEPGATARAIRLTFSRSDFPASLDDPRLDQVVLHLATRGQSVPAVTVSLRRDGVGGEARTIDGLISTRRGNAAAWEALRQADPAGQYDLSFEAAAGPLFDDGRIDDVQLVLGCSGRTPAWPT
jgi:hypothetical protein